MTPYDAEAHGARCDLCPLREVRQGGPVPPEPSGAPVALLVGEAPGKEEVEQGRPFVGQSGQELWRALGAAGYRRSRFGITNAILCRPPENKLDRVLSDLKRENKKRVAAGQEPRPTPMACCQPRLAREIAAFPKVIALGAVALQAVTGHASSIMDARGGPLELPGLRVMPALHPAFVMRSKRWRTAFRADLSRGIRWFTSGLAWKDPEILYNPAPEALIAFLRSPAAEGFRVFDVETGMAYPAQEVYEATKDPLKIIGIGDHRRVASITFIRKDGSHPYDPAAEAKIRWIVSDWISSPMMKKAGWNSGSYDRMVLESTLKSFACRLRAHLDGIGLHKLAEPELPHGLGYAGSIHTDIHAWKAGKPTEGDTQTDDERALYNARDVAVTHLCIPPLAKAVEDRGQGRAAAFWPKVQAVCVGLHRNGMHVDQKRRAAWDKKLLTEAVQRREEIRGLLNRRDFNPGSVPQIRELFFEDWGLLPYTYTLKGDPSTDDEALRYYMTKAPLPDWQRRVVVAVRRFRNVTKLRGTYVRKIRPITDGVLSLDPFEWDEEAWEEANRRRTEKNLAPGLCQEDGRIHPDYLAHGTVGWRLSSNGPNAQNFPDRLRDMIDAAPGHVLVGCDEAQLELRMVAGLANDEPYLEAFANDGDPHLDLCTDFFGRHFADADKTQKKELRRFVKEGTYASLYLAGPETVHDVLAASEDRETGDLIFANLDPRQTMLFHQRFQAKHPAIPDWWDAVIAEWRDQGYLEEPVLGLRCDFLDGEEPNKIVNLKPQSGGSAIVHLATMRLLEEVPFEKWGPGTGIVQQGHDSLVVECPEAEAEKVKTTMERCMAVSAAEAGRLWGLPVKFLGEGKIGKNWKEV